MTEDYYDLLGISRDADREEIEQAYRDQVSQHHPDVSDDSDAEERFKQLQRARDVLTDEGQRRAYDRVGHEEFVQRDRASGSDAGGGQRTRTGFHADPFGGMGRGLTGGFGGVGTLFEQFVGRRRGGATTHATTNRDRARQGADLTTSLEIGLEAAYRGGETPVTLTRPEVCPACDGRGAPSGVAAEPCPKCSGRGHIIHIVDTGLGRSKHREPCERCDGTGEVYREGCSRCGGDGRIRREATVPVAVPAGIESGQTLQLQGEGEPGERGGAPGDLIVDVTVTDHPRFDRDAADLYRRHPLSFPQAVFGDTIDIPVFDGPVELRIPSGTQSGETFRIAGEGMPHVQQPGQGDLYVQAQVVTPDELTAEQRRALRAFLDASDAEGI